MKLILIAMCLLSSVAFAQTTQQDIRVLISEIEYELDYTTDQRVLDKTQRHLLRALSTLQGGTGGPLPPTRPILTCGSRDNDGRSPYQVSYQDPRTLAFKKLKGAIFSTITECQKAISNSLIIQDSSILCTSKDADGRAPYSLNHYKKGDFKSKITVYRTLTECYKASSEAQRTNYAISVCGSRDNDGRSPYMLLSYILDSGILNRGPTFRTLTECYKAR